MAMVPLALLAGRFDRAIWAVVAIAVGVGLAALVHRHVEKLSARRAEDP